MIGFLLRKTFYDLWDNMFKIVILNLGFVACTAIPVFLPVLVSRFIDSIALEIILSAAGIIACSIYLAAASLSVKSVSDYGSITIPEFIKNFKSAWPAGLVIGLCIFLLFIVTTIIIPFYLSIESIFGLLLASVVFWTTLFCLISFQFFFAVYARLGTNIIKCFKKCMIISLDNSGFAFFSLLHNIVVLAISTILVFMFPGPVGILLYLDEALRLRLIKYDYLEANPDANRKQIPWDALLIEEREKVGTRTFRNFIFPWKD